MLEIRRSSDCLIFNMESPYLAKMVFILRWGPGSPRDICCCWWTNCSKYGVPFWGLWEFQLWTMLHYWYLPYKTSFDFTKLVDWHDSHFSSICCLKLQCCLKVSDSPDRHQYYLPHPDAVRKFFDYSMTNKNFQHFKIPDDYIFNNIVFIWGIF